LGEVCGGRRHRSGLFRQPVLRSIPMVRIAVENAPGDRRGNGPRPRVVGARTAHPQPARSAMVMVEPSGIGMALFTLRAAAKRCSGTTIRQRQRATSMPRGWWQIAGAIISQRTGPFRPRGTYRDRYQEALQQLIEAKTKGLTIKRRGLVVNANARSSI